MGIENESSGLSALSNAGIGETGSAINDAAGRNLGLSAGNGPATNSKPTGETDAWKSEPLENFVTDAHGKPKLRANGTPIRRGGRPKKPTPGCTLASGETFPRENDPQGGGAGGVPLLTGEVIDPDTGGGPGTAGEPVEPQGEPLGEAAGKVIMEAVINTAEAVGGPDARPTDSERESMTRSASSALSNVRVAPWVALALFVSIWLVRVWYVKRTKAKNKSEERKGEPATDAHSNRGADTFGKKPSGQASVWEYA